jgi:hypothetical protein
LFKLRSHIINNVRLNFCILVNISAIKQSKYLNPYRRYGDGVMSNSRKSDQEWNEFQSIRTEAGRNIDPAIAEVEWTYAQTLDPYGIDPDLPGEYQQVGR